MSAPGNASSGGFTLLEVLVALAIVAPVLAALTGAVVTAAHMQEELQFRTAAHWVALNRLAETELLDPWPSPGDRTGTERCGRLECRWELRIAATPHPDYRRLEVSVSSTGAKVALASILQRPPHVDARSATAPP